MDNMLTLAQDLNQIYTYQDPYECISGGPDRGDYDQANDDCLWWEMQAAMGMVEK